MFMRKYNTNKLEFDARSIKSIIEENERLKEEQLAAQKCTCLSKKKLYCLIFFGFIILLLWMYSEGGGKLNRFIDKSDEDMSPFFWNYTLSNSIYYGNCSDITPPYENLTSPCFRGQIKSLNRRIDCINQTFFSLFVKPRNDECNKTIKSLVREAIINRFKRWKLEIDLQRVTSEDDKLNPFGAVNIIGLLPGKYNIVPFIKKTKEFIIVAANYDTLYNSTGVVDNGSGMVVLFELLRLLSFKRPTTSVLFVAFDYKERDKFGSKKFVDDFLIQYINEGRKFIGAYIIDTLLIYNNTVNSQVINPDVKSSFEKVTKEIEDDGMRGDHVAVYMRNIQDAHLYDTFRQSFKDNNLYKLRCFNLTSKIIIPQEALRSDHASFWDEHKAYNKSLPAVLITDNAYTRDNYRECYHEVCDNNQYLTKDNIEFLLYVTDVLFDTIHKKFPNPIQTIDKRLLEVDVEEEKDTNDY